MRFVKCMCVFLLLCFNYVSAEPFERILERCNQNDISMIISESQKAGDSFNEINNVVRMMTRYYWQYIHTHQDVDFSLTQSADKRAAIRTYEACLSKIPTTTPFLSINLALYKLALGKITNGYSSEFVEARKIVEDECKKSGNRGVCDTAAIMSDIDNPNSEVIKSIPTR